MLTTDSTPQSVLDAYLAEASIDPGTREQYQVAINLARRSELFPDAGHLFTRSGIIAYRDWLRKGRSPATVCLKLRVIRLLWRYLCDEHGWQEQPPKASRINPSVPKRLPTAWTSDEFLRILQAAQDAPTVGHWTPEHWGCLLEVCWYSGARIDALLETRLKSLEGCFLTLDADHDKALTERRVQLPEGLVERLGRLNRPHGTTLLFPWAWTMETLRERYRQIVKAAGLTYTRRDMFHKIRRSSATAVAAESGPEAARAFLGHPDIRTTLKHYLDPSKIQKTSVVPCLPKPQQIG